MARTDPRHHAPKHYMGVVRNSLQHIALRVLDSCTASAVSLHAMIPESGMTPLQFLKAVIIPMQTAGLLHLDRADNTWGTTDAGSTVARTLGRLDGATVVNDFDDRAPADDAPTMEHAPGCRPLPCRPRLAMGNADRMPPVPRPGSEQATRLPSRMGGRLHWPDGRVTQADDARG